jgi:hypothetical protein
MRVAGRLTARARRQTTRLAVITADGPGLSTVQLPFFPFLWDSRAFSRLPNPPASSRWVFSYCKYYYNSGVEGGRDAGAFCAAPHDEMRMTVDRGDR